MKNFISIFTLAFILASCGQKPIIVQGKIDRPHRPIKKPILGEQVAKPTQNQSNNPLENPSLILGTQVGGNDTNLSYPQTQQVVVGTDPNLASDEPVMDPAISQSYVATLKTKKFAYSDAAFMQEENGVIDLQILSAGKPLVTLKISSDVCVDHNCISKEEFNHDYLSSAYPADLINNVLTKRPIFEGRNLKRITNGFMQKIYGPDYKIKYKTTPGSIYFRDLKNGIVIKLRRLK